MSDFDILKRVATRGLKHAKKHEDGSQMDLWAHLLDELGRAESDYIETRTKLAAANAEVNSLQHTFDLMYDAEIQAINLWRRKTGQQHQIPDKTNLTVWLLEQLSPDGR